MFRLMRGTNLSGSLPARFGPWAMVTGASDGIGREFALRLAEAGFNLILVARRGHLLDDLAHELRQRHGTTCAVVSADLSTSAGIDAAIAAGEGREVGLLVAAAGYGTSGPLLASRLEDELAMIDVNCRAVVALCRRYGESMAARRRGGIVLMSSLLAFQGVPRAANYAATKAFVQTLAEGLNRELAPHGVAVVASAPGPIRSGFETRANLRLGLAQTPSDVVPATLRALGRRGTVRPGWLSKALEASLTLLPRLYRTRILGLVMGGMTRHQDGGKAEHSRPA
jgi:short-subunit dehydrogenase